MAKKGDYGYVLFDDNAGDMMPDAACYGTLEDAKAAVAQLEPDWLGPMIVCELVPVMSATSIIQWTPIKKGKADV